MKGILSLIFWTGITVFSYGQFSPEKIALKRIEKGKWKGAEEALRKAMRKDSANAEIKYILTWYYTAAENPTANIDSAYRYVLLAMRDFSHSTTKQKEQLKHFPIDSGIIIHQRRKIDSAAFMRAKLSNTEIAYGDFLLKFAMADQKLEAIDLRDEAAFLEALRVNTIAAYDHYLLKYPTAVRANEAKQRFEKLLYQDRTHNGKLKSYEAFYNEFPLNANRAEAERNIFEISTASGRPSSFVNFIEKYPSAKLRRLAFALLYHLTKDEEDESLFMSDSIKAIQRKENGFWVPVFRNGKYGFMDQYGTETIPPTFDSVRHDYLCGNVHSDYLNVAGGIINRAGNWIFKGSWDTVDDLGLGFLKIRQGECLYAVHKSGWGFNGECYEDVKIVARNFIAFQHHGKWGLASLAGKTLYDAQFDDVLSLDTLILLIGNGKKSLATLSQIASIAERINFFPSLVFDDVRRLGNSNFLVSNGTLQGVINQDLKFVIPLDRHTITLSPVGFILENNQKFTVTELPGVLETREFDDVKSYESWMRLKEGKAYSLYNLKKQKFENGSLDSVWFQRQLAFARHRDSVRVYMNAFIHITYSIEDKISFIKSVDSSRYFFISNRIKKTVFDAVTGKQMFTIETDAIEYIGHNAFLISKDKRKGIINNHGQILLPVEYIAIVISAGDWISLLKDKKFGSYNLSTHKLVKAVYDHNVKQFSRKLLVANKGALYGFIDFDARPQSDFEFDEIRPWNDTSALVKRNFQWMIYKIRSRKIEMNDIKDYHFVTESPEETILIIRKNNYFGVISNHRGILIPPNFTEIVNIGSSETPLFFTDKNVEEAGIHVIIYYDKNGKVLRKQALDDDEYDKLLCE